MQKEKIAHFFEIQPMLPIELQKLELYKTNS